jgi:hypothetical protein
MADQTAGFAMTYFVDRDNGEVYSERTRYGDFAWNEDKGGEWKAGYHSTEFGYYLYLYGNLFIHHQPVILNYMITPLPFDRDILLTPLAIADDALQILQVLHDEQTYTNYDPISRELHLPAGTGGRFTVTFGQQPDPILAEQSKQYPRQASLGQNYPNPFNNTTAIGYQLSTGSHVELAVYNPLGQKVAVLVSKIQSAGQYRVQWNAENLASGVYIYQLRTKSGFISTKKLILLK